MLLFVKLALLLTVGGSSLVLAQTGITVDPLINSTVPVTFDENNTYSCEVTGNRQAIWEINNRQISGQRARDEFGRIGVVVTGTLGGSMTELTFTKQGRDTYLTLNQSTIPIRCTAFDNARPVTEFGEFFFINIYDVPVAPPNFSFNPDPYQLSTLTLSWDQPPGIPEGVSVNYTVTISGPRVNRNATISETMYIFTDEESQTCQEHTFSVFATNPAGDGAVATMEETIPISPNIASTSTGLQLGSINLARDSSVSFEVFFPLGSTCSDTNFPITNHSVVVTQLSLSGSGREEVGRTSFTEDQTMTTPAIISIPALMQDRDYRIFVQACINITCRDTRSIPLITSDVQEASLTFFENNIFMTCTFADTVTSQGCVFNLTLANGTEMFYLRRDDDNTMASQCNVSSSQRMAYTSIEVMDWESDGTLGALRIPIPMPVVVEQEGNYTQRTGCVVERPGLSGGAIAGIVLAIIAFAIIAVAIAIVVAILVYKLRTGKWFKLKHKDEERVTVSLEKSWLMDDEEIKEKPSLKRMLSWGKQNKLSTEAETKDVSKTETDSPSSPDGVTDPPAPVDSMTPHMAITGSTAAAVATMPPTPSLSLAPQPLKSLDLLINPEAAFTMDIGDDKKVRLHLNRTLIKQVLRENNIDLNKRVKRKGRGHKTTERLESRPLLSLAMTSEVRVSDGDGTHEGSTIQEEASGANL